MFARFAHRVIAHLIILLLAGFYPLFADGMPIFQSPFDSEFPLGNWHDHQLPREFVDADGIILNSEGRSCNDYIDGHEGYDWVMPEGTPLYAVADGTITFAGLHTPFYCPLLDQTVSDIRAVLEVVVAGRSYFIHYVHLSSTSVSIGQTIRRGEVIGYSGNTGCSTGAHLHFAVYTLGFDGATFSPVDPYGWNGTETDPWTLAASGAESVNFWQSGEAPERFFIDSFAANDCSGCRAPVAITKVRWMGANDQRNPNNEFVEFSLDPRFGARKRDLTGFRLKNNQGKVVRLRPAAQTSAKKPLRVFSGSGRNTNTKLFLNQKKGIWDDNGDCVRLLDETGRLMYYFILGNAQCPFPTPFAGRARIGDRH